MIVNIAAPSGGHGRILCLQRVIFSDELAPYKKSVWPQDPKFRENPCEPDKKT